MRVARIRERRRGYLRALFLFQVLYGHEDGGISGFFRQISYLTGTLDVWPALKSAFRYFGDREMLSLVEKMETAYSNEMTSEAVIAELDRLYAARISETARRIASRIRENPEIEKS